MNPRPSTRVCNVLTTEPPMGYRNTICFHIVIQFPSCHFCSFLHIHLILYIFILLLCAHWLNTSCHLVQSCAAAAAAVDCLVSYCSLSTVLLVTLVCQLTFLVVFWLLCCSLYLLIQIQFITAFTIPTPGCELTSFTNRYHPRLPIICYPPDLFGLSLLVIFRLIFH